MKYRRPLTGRRRGGSETRPYALDSDDRSASNLYFFTFFARNAVVRCQASLAAAS
jgi:hypothetical protein